MASRWRFITSSYLSTFLRCSALRPSTCACAFWIAFETKPNSSAMSSGIDGLFMIRWATPGLKLRMSSSVRER